MTVLETPALRATSSTAKSGPAQPHRLDGGGDQLLTAGAAVLGPPRPPAVEGGQRRLGRLAGARRRAREVDHTLHVFHGNSYPSYSRTRRLGELADDRHPAYVHAHRDPRQSGKKPVDRQALSPRLLGSAAKKSYDPGRRHRLGRADPGRPLRSVTGVVDAVRHAAVGRDSPRSSGSR